MKQFKDLYSLYFDGSEFAHVGRSKRDGAKVGSGRYPLGSGKNPNQHEKKSKSSSLFNKIFGNKTNNNSSEFDYSYKLDTESNPDDYKLLRSETRNVYETLSSEIGGVKGMTSESRGYKHPGNKRDTVLTKITMEGKDLDEKEIFKALTDNDYKIYNKKYDEDCNLVTLTVAYKPFKVGHDDQDIIINFEPGSTFKDPKHTYTYGDRDIRIDHDGQMNDNLKKYMYKEDIDFYKNFAKEMYINRINVLCNHNTYLDKDVNRYIFYVSPKRDQKKQVEDINNIMKKNGYKGYDYDDERTENVDKLVYNKYLDNNDYAIMTPTKRGDWIEIRCPSIEAYEKNGIHIDELIED